MPANPVFDETKCGCTLEAEEKIGLVKIVDFFKLFFSQYFLQRIINATNTYAGQQRAAEPEKHKGKWTDIEIPEMIKFFTLTMLMGLIRKPRIKDYWTRLECISTPFFTSIMRRDRFVAILRYVYIYSHHFVLFFIFYVLRNLTNLCSMPLDFRNTN